MTPHEFETPTRIRLFVELERGDVVLTARETSHTTVRCEGGEADQVIVRQQGEEISVVGPRRTGFLRTGSSITVSVDLPLDSDVHVETGSADLTAAGRLGSARVKTGSGELSFDEIGGPAMLQTGSGDITAARLGGEARLQSGSGDVRLGEAGGELAVSTGSGDVEVAHALAAASVKTGSGDLRVRRAESDVTLASGSGDLVVDHTQRGVVHAKGATSDVLVGIPEGVPVYSDISTVTGSVRSDIDGVGAPAEGQEYVEVHARTVSGDVQLRRV